MAIRARMPIASLSKASTVSKKLVVLPDVVLMASN
jgi:hypothetical protein